MKHRTGYLFKRGDNYYVAWRTDGKLQMKSLRDEQGQPITTKEKAEQARAKFMAPMAVASEAESLASIASRANTIQVKLDEQAETLPITQAWTAFISSPNRPDSGSETLYQYECQWSRFADWMKEKYPAVITLRQVTKEVAEQYADSLNHGTLSPNTYNKHLGLLTLVFRVLKHKAKMTGNPWEEIQRKRLATHSRRELTVDELRTVCQSAQGELRLLLALGVYTGLRLGDCATLRWCETELTRNTITRIPNKLARSKPKPVIVPIHPSLRAMLNETPAESRGEYVLPEMAGLYANRSDLVTDKVQNHLKQCGIKVWQPGTGKDGKRAVIQAGFHSLRHTFVSLCRESNAPLAVVESIVGHSSPSMTRYYTHVGEVAANSAIAALPAVLGDAKEQAVKPSPAAIVRQIKALAKAVTVRNLADKQAELLALLQAC